MSVDNYQAILSTTSTALEPNDFNLPTKLSTYFSAPDVILSHIGAYIYDATNSLVATVKFRDSDNTLIYTGLEDTPSTNTVTFIAGTGENPDTIHFDTAITEEYNVITLLDAQYPLQNSQFLNVTTFRLEAVERALDKLGLLGQSHQEKIDRALLLSPVNAGLNSVLDPIESDDGLVIGHIIGPHIDFPLTTDDINNLPFFVDSIPLAGDTYHQFTLRGNSATTFLGLTQAQVLALGTGDGNGSGQLDAFINAVYNGVPDVPTITFTRVDGTDPITLSLINLKGTTLTSLGWVKTTKTLTATNSDGSTTSTFLDGVLIDGDTPTPTPSGGGSSGNEDSYEFINAHSVTTRDFDAGDTGGTFEYGGVSGDNQSRSFQFAQSISSDFTFRFVSTAHQNITSNPLTYNTIEIDFGRLNVRTDNATVSAGIARSEVGGNLFNITMPVPTLIVIAYGHSATPADRTLTITKTQRISSESLDSASIRGQSLIHNAITNRELGPAAVHSTNIDNLAVGAGKLNANAVTTVTIAENAVTGFTIAGTTITDSNMANDAVISRVIEDGAVTNQKLPSGVITSGKLDTNSVSTIKIQDGAVTLPKLDPNISFGGDIAENAITGKEVRSRTLSVTKLTSHYHTGGGSYVFSLNTPINEQISNAAARAAITGGADTLLFTNGSRTYLTGRVIEFVSGTAGNKDFTLETNFIHNTEGITFINRSDSNVIFSSTLFGRKFDQDFIGDPEHLSIHLGHGQYAHISRADDAEGEFYYVDRRPLEERATYNDRKGNALGRKHSLSVGNTGTNFYNTVRNRTEITERNYNETFILGKHATESELFIYIDGHVEDPHNGFGYVINLVNRATTNLTVNIEIQNNLGTIAGGKPATVTLASGNIMKFYSIGTYFSYELGVSGDGGGFDIATLPLQTDARLTDEIGTRRRTGGGEVVRHAGEDLALGSGNSTSTLAKVSITSGNTTTEYWFLAQHNDLKVYNLHLARQVILEPDLNAAYVFDYGDHVFAASRNGIFQVYNKDGTPDSNHPFYNASVNCFGGFLRVGSRLHIRRQVNSIAFTVYDLASATPQMVITDTSLNHLISAQNINSQTLALDEDYCYIVTTGGAFQLVDRESGAIIPDNERIALFPDIPTGNSVLKGISVNDDRTYFIPSSTTEDFKVYSAGAPITYSNKRIILDGVRKLMQSTLDLDGSSIVRPISEYGGELTLPIRDFFDIRHELPAITTGGSRNLNFSLGADERGKAGDEHLTCLWIPLLNITNATNLTFVLAKGSFGTGGDNFYRRTGAYSIIVNNAIETVTMRGDATKLNNPDAYILPASQTGDLSYAIVKWNNHVINYVRPFALYCHANVDNTFPVAASGAEDHGWDDSALGNRGHIIPGRIFSNVALPARNNQGQFLTSHTLNSTGVSCPMRVEYYTQQAGFIPNIDELIAGERTNVRSSLKSGNPLVSPREIGVERITRGAFAYAADDIHIDNIKGYFGTSEEHETYKVNLDVIDNTGKVIRKGGESEQVRITRNALAEETYGFEQDEILDARFGGLTLNAFEVQMRKGLIHKWEYQGAVNYVVGIMADPSSFLVLFLYYLNSDGELQASTTTLGTSGFITGPFEFSFIRHNHLVAITEDGATAVNLITGTESTPTALRAFVNNYANINRVIYEESTGIFFLPFSDTVTRAFQFDDNALTGSELTTVPTTYDGYFTGLNQAVFDGTFVYGKTSADAQVIYHKDDLTTNLADLFTLDTALKTFYVDGTTTYYTTLASTAFKFFDGEKILSFPEIANFKFSTPIPIKQYDILQLTATRIGAGLNCNLQYINGNEELSRMQSNPSQLYFVGGEILSTLTSWPTGTKLTTRLTKPALISSSTETGFIPNPAVPSYGFDIEYTVDRQGIVTTQGEKIDKFIQASATVANTHRSDDLRGPAFYTMVPIQPEITMIVPSGGTAPNGAALVKLTLDGTTLPIQPQVLTSSNHFSKELIERVSVTKTQVAGSDLAVTFSFSSAIEGNQWFGFLIFNDNADIPDNYDYRRVLNLGFDDVDPFKRAVINESEVIFPKAIITIIPANGIAADLNSNEVLNVDTTNYFNFSLRYKIQTLSLGSAIPLRSDFPSDPFIDQTIRRGKFFYRWGGSSWRRELSHFDSVAALPDDAYNFDGESHTVRGVLYHWVASDSAWVSASAPTNAQRREGVAVRMAFPKINSEVGRYGWRSTDSKPDILPNSFHEFIVHGQNYSTDSDKGHVEVFLSEDENADSLTEISLQPVLADRPTRRNLEFKDRSITLTENRYRSPRPILHNLYELDPAEIILDVNFQAANGFFVFNETGISFDPANSAQSVISGRVLPFARLHYATLTDSPADFKLRPVHWMNDDQQYAPEQTTAQSKEIFWTASDRATLLIAAKVDNRSTTPEKPTDVFKSVNLGEFRGVPLNDNGQTIPAPVGAAGIDWNDVDGRSSISMASGTVASGSTTINSKPSNVFFARNMGDSLLAGINFHSRCRLINIVFSIVED